VYFHVGRVIRDLRRVLGARFPIYATEEALPITTLFASAGRAAAGVRVVTGGVPGRRGATQFELHAAAATEVLLDAIARSDGTRDGVVRALAGTRLPSTPIGPVTLDRRGEPTVSRAFVVRAQHGGAPVHVDGIEGGVVERLITLPS
jgi:hypothetical protein